MIVRRGTKYIRERETVSNGRTGMNEETRVIPAEADKISRAIYSQPREMACPASPVASLRNFRALRNRNSSSYQQRV